MDEIDLIPFRIARFQCLLFTSGKNISHQIFMYPPAKLKVNHIQSIDSRFICIYDTRVKKISDCGPCVNPVCLLDK